MSNEFPKIESYAEMMVRFHPALERTCSDCGRKNNAGEYFGMKGGLSLKYYCPECEKVDKAKRKAEQDALYASGEETPDDTDEITCPWCGYADSDSGEGPDEDDECECGDCGGIFSYVRNYTVTYSSERVSPPEPDEEDDEIE